MNTLQLNPRNRWDLFLSIITLLLLCLSLLIKIPTFYQWLWVGILMVLTGIPHGATDHLVYWLESSDSQSKSWKGFLVPYLIQVAIYASCWAIFPIFSLAIFFILTFYHFGQSELFYINLPESSFLKRLIYILWGGGIMSIILLGHASETIPYLHTILPSTFLYQTPWSTIYLPFTMSIFIAWIFLMIIVRRRKLITKIDFIREILVTLLLIISLNVLSLWMSFGLYFGLWHSTKAIRAELIVLQSEKKSWTLKKWIIQALPFSLISFIGLGLIVFLWQILTIPIHPIFIFFVGISTLTLPHMTTLEKLYSHIK